MNTENEIVVATPSEISNDILVSLANNPDITPEKLQAFMDLRDREEDRRAKRAYTEAITAFSAEAPTIRKDKENSQYKSTYTSIEALVNPTVPVLAAHGLSHRWTFPEGPDGQIGVACTLTHRDGHSETVTRFAPPDTSGAKNPIQQIKSTTTYLEIITFQAVTGLVSAGHMDDDGNGSGGSLITPEQEEDLALRLAAIDGNLPAFLKVFKVGALAELTAKQYTRANAMVAAQEAKCAS